MSHTVFKIYLSVINQNNQHAIKRPEQNTLYKPENPNYENCVIWLWNYLSTQNTELK